MSQLSPEIRLHGTVKPLIVPERTPCEEAVEGLPAAQFEGTYWPQDKALPVCRWIRRPGVRPDESRSSPEEITGHSFSIELIRGAYNGYTRGGYIEGGNIQVES